MILLKDKADKDLQQHNAEMKELCRIIDHDRKLRDFMNTKGSDRPEEVQMVAWRQRKGEFMNTKGSDRPEEVQVVAWRLRKGDFMNTKGNERQEAQMGAMGQKKVSS